MSSTHRAAARGARPRLPYEITCTRCSARLLVVHGEWILLMGRRPVELSAGPDGDVLTACHACGTLVPIDERVLLLH